jgi:hypothetical protein
MRDVFLSHASVDRPLVESFAVDLLESGAGITHDQVYCPCLEGQGIPPGIDFNQHIHKTLSNAKCVIALITRNYYASAFCLCELGATWILSKSFVPLIVPPITFQDLEAVLQGTQCLRIENQRDLDHLRDILHAFIAKPTSTGRWNTRRDAFLDKLPSILKVLPVPESVKPEELSIVITERDEYKQLNADLDREVSILKDKYKKVSLGAAL